MPKFRITSPEGKTYEINAPDGANQQQVMEFAQAQFGTKKQPPPQEAAPNPTDDMGTGERLLAGVGSGMTDLAYGVGQRLGLVDQATIDEKKRLDEPLKNTTAGAIGSVGGKVALGLPAAFIPGANTLAGAGVIGAAQGVAEPTATGESVLKNAAIGGAAGVGGVALGRLLRAGYQGARGLIEPFTEAGQQRIAGRTLERFASDPAALRGASSAPTATGARPTLAEATRDPGIATLERAIGQQDPQIATAIGQRAAENNAARVGVAQGIAGDGSQRAAAESARKEVGDKMYKAATGAAYKVDDRMAELLKRPAVQQAMQRAKTLAENQGRKFSFFAQDDALKYTPPANYPVTLQGQLAEEAKRLSIEARKSGSFSGLGVPKAEPVQKISGQGLQDLKMAMDEMLTDPASGFAGKAGATVKALRGQVMDWMESANPAFKDARTAYAASSKPINQMDVGQRLLDKTTGAIRDLGGNQRLQANAFARALNDEQALVRNATGFKGVNALSDVMTPPQINQLNAVRDELELVANLSQAANGPGSQTAKSLASQNLMRQLLGPTGLPQSWAESTLLQTLLRPVQFGMQAAEPSIQNKLSEILLNPAMARNALQAAQPAQISPAIQRLLPYLQQAGQQSGPAALVSGQR